jgi:hypothetical protein
MFTARFLKELRDNSTSGSLVDLANMDEAAFFESNAWKGALDWFTMPTQLHNFAETFVVSRTQIPREIVGGLVSTLTLPTDLRGDDLVANERISGKVAKVFGDWVRKNFTPFTQLVDFERATGIRTSDKKDMSDDPVYGDPAQTFSQNFMRPLRQAGIALSPSEEEKLRPRERLFAREGVVERRKAPASTFFLGISVDERDAPAAERLQDLGFGEFWGHLGSKSRIGSIRAKETQILRGFLPFIVSTIDSLEDEWRQEYRSSPTQQKKHTEEHFVKIKSRNKATQLSRKYKGDINKVIENKGVLAKDPSYATFLLKFRILSDAEKSEAMSHFRTHMGREPDATNVEDLFLLVKLGKKERDIVKGMNIGGMVKPQGLMSLSI